MIRPLVPNHRIPGKSDLLCVSDISHMPSVLTLAPFTRVATPQAETLDRQGKSFHLKLKDYEATMARLTFAFSALLLTRANVDFLIISTKHHITISPSSGFILVVRWDENI
jgi:hypothetical protein